MALPKFSVLNSPTIITPSTVSFPTSIDSSSDLASPLHFTELLGQWYITHSSSPVWRDKRNVLMTYTPLGPVPDVSTLSISTSGTYSHVTQAEMKWPILDNTVTYQSLKSDKIERIPGTETPTPPSLGQKEEKATVPTVWTWRGTRLLKWISLKWEILGYGPPISSSCTESTTSIKSGSGAQISNSERAERDFLVIYAQKTMFAPSVLNICTRSSQGLERTLLSTIQERMKSWGIPEIDRLVGEMYDVVHN